MVSSLQVKAIFLFIKKITLILKYRNEFKKLIQKPDIKNRNINNEKFNQ